MEPVLPRLLYFSDVLAEATYSGSMLVHRLLEPYPPDRLLIAETSHLLSRPERRLPGVRYVAVPAGSDRLSNTRLHAWWALWTSVRAASWAHRMPLDARVMRPQAVLTVLHGYAWMAAAAHAARTGVPLHLIVHDDWPRMVELPRPFARRIDREAGRVYRRAASRLCVSPWMAEAYRARYGAEGAVLYPSRGRSTPAFTEPPARLAQPREGFTVGFAGTIRGEDALRCLALVARVLGESGGRVVIFGPVPPSAGVPADLKADHVEWCGLVDAGALSERLRRDVDTLLVPMSFAANDLANVSLNFPSKLVDYTAVGLPLLVCGPRESSAVKWARQHDGVAEVVESLDRAAIAAALDRLRRDPGHRVRLAARALDVGTRLFSHEAAWEMLVAALTGQAATCAARPGGR